VGLYEPLLAFAAEHIDAWAGRRDRRLLRIAGICGRTPQAVAEAATAQGHGYHAGLLSLVAMGEASEDELLAHVRAVGEILPVIGFYLQQGVGGRVLPYSFWRRFAEIPSVVAIKIAPFNRYRTLDVVRAVIDAGRAGDIALYTGNDDTIVTDLLTSFRFDDRHEPAHIAGGLLGHWGVWTRSAVELQARLAGLRERGARLPPEILTLAAQVSDMNAAVFDAANGFRGCIPGIHEVLRRQGLLAGTWCLDPHEQLSPGQAEELDRVTRAYPHLIDSEWTGGNLATWMGD
jgi:dihydrodipicolinate synthase/N-acetylneuraminate lyase